MHVYHPMNYCKGILFLVSFPMDKKVKKKQDLEGLNESDEREDAAR